jgi:alpha-ketoglutarate-dependent sulfate ester dioxygenase
MTAVGTKLEVRRLNARIGAEVTGLNLSTQLDSDTVSQIRSALNEHKALVFRDVELDDAGQQRFAGYFGDLTKAHPTVASVEGQPNILPVDSEDGGRANSWHTDLTFVVNPPQASTLRSITLPPFGGETLIATTAAHTRINYDDQPRRLNRVTVAGDIPVGVNGEKSFSIEGDASDYSTVAESPAAEAAAA